MKPFNKLKAKKIKNQSNDELIKLIDVLSDKKQLLPIYLVILASFLAKKEKP